LPRHAGRFQRGRLLALSQTAALGGKMRRFVQEDTSKNYSPIYDIYVALDHVNLERHQAVTCPRARFRDRRFHYCRRGGKD
jgi:hypothetical protein